MIPNRSDIAPVLRTALLSGRNQDGGWPYYAGKTSRLEPTCAAFLALGPTIEAGGATFTSTVDDAGKVTFSNSEGVASR